MNLKEANTNLILNVLSKEGWFLLKDVKEKYSRDLKSFINYYHKDLFDRRKVTTGNPGRPPHEYKLKEDWKNVLES